MRQLVYLLTGSLGLWLLLGLPAWLLSGDTALLDSAVACGLCLVPMTATMLWCNWAFAGKPEDQVLAALGGTSVRLVIVALGGILLFKAVEALHRPAFLIWVVVFYLATLTLEIALVVRRQAVLAPAPNNPRPE